jgi:hypothetical protein
MSLSRFGGSATRSLDGADPAGPADPGHRGPVEQHLDRSLSVAFDTHTVRLIEPRRPLTLLWPSDATSATRHS